MDVRFIANNKNPNNNVPTSDPSGTTPSPSRYSRTRVSPQSHASKEAAADSPPPPLCGTAASVVWHRLRPSLTHHQGDEEVHAHDKGGAADGAATQGVQGANHEANVVESPQQGGHGWTSHAKVSQEMDTRSCTQEVDRFQFGWR